MSTTPRSEETTVDLTTAESRKDDRASLPDRDVEKQEAEVKVQATNDIEHLEVKDDPRLWSKKKKTLTLAYICYCGLAGATLGNIIFPALTTIQDDLNISDALISLSVALFILLLGVCPIVWNIFGELYGRKPLYMIANIILFVSCLINGLAPNADTFVAFRILSAIGGSAVLNVGAGTLADMYEPSERGTKMGIFYAAPLLGPSVGTLLGGVISYAGGWRAPLYMMTGYAATTVVLTFFMKDTFRPERSAAWTAARKRAAMEDQAKTAKIEAPVERSVSKVSRMLSRSVSRRTTAPKPFKPSWKDLSPFGPTKEILGRWNNVFVIIASGALFGSQYQLTYTASKTFAEAPYFYNDLIIGLVLLAFGGGNVIGSVAGGKYSDMVLRRLTKKNNGVREAEMRIKSTFLGMIWLPPAYVAYAWTVEKQTNIAGPVVSLAVAGISMLWVYSSSLAYLVDANPGRASTAIAYNSACRGLTAFVASEIADPLEAAMGTGWLYTGWAIVLAVCEVLLIYVAYRGKALRNKAEQKSKQAEAKADQKATEKASHKA